MKKYLNYIINFQCTNIEEVAYWVNINLKNYLEKKLGAKISEYEINFDYKNCLIPTSGPLRL